jgi:Xaa-Pro aminopeptidase
MARAMLSAAGPGVLESEVYAAGMAAAFERGTVVPGMHLWSGAAPLGAAPPAWAYRPQRPRVLQDGDLILAEVFSAFGMRATQHQVAIAVGEVHPDVERAAAVARSAYDAGLSALRPKSTFGEVAAAMLKPSQDAGAWVCRPQVHGLNPFGAFCGFPADVGEISGAENYPGWATPFATRLGDMELEPGMVFAFEPNCGFGRRSVTIGGTVIVGQDEAIELNPYTARVLRVGNVAG